MSLSEGRGRSALLNFLADRVRRDLQFSNIFRVDFAAALAYTAATLYLLARNDLFPHAAPVLLALVAAYAVLHVVKILLVIYLERRGGDAREFVGSERLVTSGVYAFSRNPVYVLSLVQSFVWSLILVCLGAGHANAWPARRSGSAPQAPGRIRRLLRPRAPMVRATPDLTNIRDGSARHGQGETDRACFRVSHRLEIPPRSYICSSPNRTPARREDAVEPIKS